MAGGKSTGGVWLCSCGVRNLGSAESCLSCGARKEVAQSPAATPGPAADASEDAAAPPAPAAPVTTRARAHPAGERKQPISPILAAVVVGQIAVIGVLGGVLVARANRHAAPPAGREVSSPPTAPMPSSGASTDPGSSPAPQQPVQPETPQSVASVEPNGSPPAAEPNAVVSPPGQPRGKDDVRQFMEWVRFIEGQRADLRQTRPPFHEVTNGQPTPADADQLGEHWATYREALVRLRELYIGQRPPVPENCRPLDTDYQAGMIGAEEVARVQEFGVRHPQVETIGRSVESAVTRYRNAMGRAEADLEEIFRQTGITRFRIDNAD